MMLFVAGVILILAGVYSIIEPWHSFGYFVKYTGLALVASAGLLLFCGFIPGISSGERKLITIESVVDLVFASVLIFNPFLTVVAYPLIIGIWVLLRGLVKVILAVSVFHKMRGSRNILIAGIISMSFGLVFIMYPSGRIREVGFLISIFAILMGALYMYDVVRLRRSDATLAGIV